MPTFNPDELNGTRLSSVSSCCSFLRIAERSRKSKKQEEKLKEKDRYRPAAQPEKPVMTEEHFNRSWKALSYILLLAGAGNLYMAYNAVTKAIQTGVFGCGG